MCLCLFAHRRGMTAAENSLPQPGHAEWGAITQLTSSQAPLPTKTIAQVAILWTGLSGIILGTQPLRADAGKSAHDLVFSCPLLAANALTDRPIGKAAQSCRAALPLTRSR